MKEQGDPGDSLLFFRQLAMESDRGAAIVGCSLVEAKLEQLLRAKMNAVSKKQADALFGPYAPLATFSGKIAICFAFGFIDESTFHDLEIFRKIRNRFAHDLGSQEFFDAATFQQLCRLRCSYPIGTSDYAGATFEELKQERLELSLPDGCEPKTVELTGARSKFLLSVHILSGRLSQACTP